MKIKINVDILLDLQEGEKPSRLMPRAVFDDDGTQIWADFQAMRNESDVAVYLKALTLFNQELEKITTEHLEKKGELQA